MGRRKVSQGWYCQKKRCSQLSCMTQGTPELQFTAAMERNFVEAKLQNTPIQCLVDSGASISCISQHQLQRLQHYADIQESSITSAVGVCGEVHPVLGEVMLEVTFGHITVKQKFRVFETLHSKVIFGLDFLQENKIRTDFENMTLTIPFPGKNLNYSIESGSADHITVSTIRDQRAITTMAETVNHVILEPHSETILPVKIPNYSPGATVILEPSNSLQSRFSVAGGKTVTYLDDNQIGIYRVLNPTNLPVYIKSNLQIAAAQPVNFEDVHYLQQQEPAFLCSLSENNEQFDKDYASILSDIGIDLDSCDLDNIQRQQLCKFLAQNRNIFAKDLSELGKTDMHYHTIHTKGDKVVSSAPYRQSPQMRAELERQLDEMEKHGIIEESTSPFHSPVVLVKKRNNEYRFCVDFRALNRIAEPMSFTIPHMSDILDTLADAKPEIYSTLDLRSGFWQVPLDPATKHKSAFITHKGVYEFNRLAFGMMNSPMTFQCLMTKVLRNLNFKVALVYIDDVLIFSKNFQEHLQHLHLVFSSLRRANLKLHPSKCIFAKKEVKYLGHIISKHGVRVNPENTEKVKTFPVPQNTKQVKSFLGMANYYRKFVKDYAQIASPLTSLLKKNVKFQWTLSCQKAYDTLKNALVTAPILAFPDFDKPFILSTDASEYSMGYVLSQIQNGREHAIAYGGRSLHGTELKWHITDKEALALVEGIQHFKHYLANKEFTVFTDNVSVKYLQKIRDCQGRLGRWSLLLQGYNFKIVHRDGSKNPADCLSRQQHDDSPPHLSPRGLGHHRIRGNNSYMPSPRDRGQPIVNRLKLTSKSDMHRAITRRGEVVCEQPIAKVSSKLGIMRCGEDGKPSKTTFTRLSYNGKTSVVQCKPHTGRTHQIRVHLQYLGFPIVNDPCYNSLCFGPEKGKGGNYQLTDEQIHKLKEEEHNKEMWTVKGDNPDFPKRIQELREEEKERDSDDPKDISQVPEPDPKRTKLDSDVKSDTASASGESFTSDCDVPSSVQTLSHSEQRLTMDGKPQLPFQWEKWFPSESCPQCKKQYLDPKPSQLRLYLHALSYKGPDWHYQTSMPPWAEPDWEEDDADT